VPFSTSLGPHELHFTGSYRPYEDSSSRLLSPLGRCLRAFKDHGDRYAGRCVANVFAATCVGVVAGYDLIVTVPSDPQRLRERGHAPAAWLGRALARRSGIRRSASALVRIPGRPPQRGLGGTERRANASGAFRLGQVNVQGYAIMLVDDVITTGATLLGAASCLGDAGAAKVDCAVLACADEERIAACRSRTGNGGTSATFTQQR